MARKPLTKRVWQNAGAPSDGGSGTLAGDPWLEKGDLLIDITNGTLYQNTNTQASPTWSQIVGGTGASLDTDVGNMATDGTATANALGSASTAAPIDHVHKLGDHDHSGATKGGAIALAALGAGFFTADATGRAKFASDFFDATKFADIVADDAITNAFLDAKVADDAFDNTFLLAAIDADAFDNALCDLIFANNAFAADAASRAMFADGIWTGAKLADGALSADATGRAKIATDFFNAATVLDLFATDSIDSTAAAAIIADNAIPSSKVNWSYGGAGDIVTIVPDASADAGSESGVARIDHTHAIACAAPSAGLAAADAEGSSNSFARADHVHKATLANDVYFVGRNNADDGDINVFKVNASDQIELGADLYPGAHNIIMTGYVSIGSTVADSGGIRIPNDTVAVVARNAGDDGNVNMWKVNASDQIEAGADVNMSTNGLISTGYISVGASPADAGGIRIPNNTYLALARNQAGGGNINMWKVNASDDLEAGADVDLGSNNLFTTGYVSIGSTVADSGGIRIPNDTYLALARNNGDDGNVSLIKANASDLIEFGASLAATTFAGTVSMADQAIDFTTGYIEFGTTPAASGDIRQENNTVLWAARNAGDDGDISGWKVNAEDDYEAAADVNLGGNKLYGGTAANADLDLNATTNGTETTSYIIARQMLDCTVGMVATLVKAGAVGDAETNQTDINGLMAIDSTNHRFYFRYGDAWHYCSQDAGFAFPEWERNCPICGNAIEVGDSVVGVIDSIQEDGARHGVYCHASCVGESVTGINLPNKAEAPKGKGVSEPSAREKMLAA
jgi:hypothetical protein